MGQAAKLGQKALALDDSSAEAHALFGSIYLLRRQHEKAIAEGELSVSLNPNGADNMALLGMTLNFAGRPEEAIALFDKAIRLNPIPPNMYLHHLAVAYLLTGRYEETIAAAERILDRNPDFLFAHLDLAASYALSGREEEARAAASDVLRINPKASIKYWEKTLPFKNQADKELVIGAWRKAGLPDTPPLPLPD